MESIIYDKIYISLKNLLEVNEEVQKTYNKSLRLNPLSWAKDYCTTKIFLPPKTGLTTALCKIIRDKFEKVIFIDSQNHMPVIFMRSVSENMSDKMSFVSFEMIEKIKVLFEQDKQERIKAIIIDSYSLLDKKKEDVLYKICLPFISKRETFFFICSR